MLLLWQVKEEFVADRDDLTRRNIMDGDPFMSTSSSWRFRRSEAEPYMPSQAPGECVRAGGGGRGGSAWLGNMRYFIGPEQVSLGDQVSTDVGMHAHAMSSGCMRGCAIIKCFNASHRPTHAGTAWFKTRRISKEAYKEMIEAQKERAEMEAASSSGGETSEEDEGPRRSAKDRIDSAW